MSEEKQNGQIQEETVENSENQNNELEKLQAEYNELKDTYLRANAEFENIKKRMEKEKFQQLFTQMKVLQKICLMW